jgi:AraC-like DNA-binding protein
MRTVKPVLFNISETETESFQVQVDEHDHYYDSLHFHPEIQLALIVKGKGYRFIGDSIDRFGPGDLLLIGPNLPHVFRCDKEYYEKNPNLGVYAILVFFSAQSLSNAFLAIPEMHRINELISNCQKGLKITGKTRTAVSKLMNELLVEKGFDRLLTFLKILDLISSSKTNHQLSNIGYDKPQKESDNERLNKVIDHVLNHFSKKVLLEDVASIANMTPNAFCRFFKHRTEKTFSRFLNEIRIGHACKLLVSEDINVSQAAYDCGYNNISNFNRQFKEITGFTPSEFVAQY